MEGRKMNDDEEYTVERHEEAMRVEEKDIKKESKPDREKEGYEMVPAISVGNWFFTFLIQDIPVIGIIALLIWACSDKFSEGKRQYAIARLMYQLIFTGITGVTIYILYIVGTGLLTKLIDYMQML